MNLEWAQEEIKLAKEEADKYGKDSLDSAYKSYIKLYKEGSTGYSCGHVTEILQRLVERKPLTAISDLPEIWKKAYDCYDYVTYSCKRMPTLIKTVWNENNKTEYDDLDRVFCVDISTGDVCRLKIARELINKLYPIEMPYYPQLGYFKVYYKREGQNKITFLYLTEPKGQKVTLNRNYEYDNSGNEWKEIANE